MADINPLRYRGYYYDTETGFYYLQSRYYDPVMHRFINADSYASTGQGVMGINMFVYCNNNPINFSDPNGNMAGGSCTTIVNDGGGSYALPQGLYYTSDQVALAFAEKYYRYTYLTDGEVGAFILRTAYRGTPAYYYGCVVFSGTSELTLSFFDVAGEITDGSMIVGDIHTHPRGAYADVFSVPDVKARRELINGKEGSTPTFVDINAYNAYLVTPLRTVVKMDISIFAYEGILVGHYQIGFLGGKSVIITKYCMN